MPPAPNTDSYALTAPKAQYLSVDEYAKKAALDAGISPRQFLSLISCESNWKEDAVGDNNKSLGILQFQKPTFDRFAKKYKKGFLDISDPYDQIDLAALMISDGHQEHWYHCSRKVGLL